MKLLKKISIFIFAVSFLFGCIAKNEIKIPKPDNLYSCVLENNKQVCDYKGKALVSFKDSDDKLKFKAIMDKRCQDTLMLKILGGFGKILYDIVYSRGHIFAMKEGADVTGEIISRGFLPKIKEVVAGLKYPYIIPDSTYFVSESANGYLFTKENVSVAADKNCRITNVTTLSKKYIYEYDKERIDSVTIVENDAELKISFKE